MTITMEQFLELTSEQFSYKVTLDTRLVPEDHEPKLQGSYATGTVTAIAGELKASFDWATNPMDVVVSPAYANFTVLSSTGGAITTEEHNWLLANLFENADWLHQVKLLIKG